VHDAYRIADEPAESPLSKLAVSPLWPMLAVMFGGAGLSWSWFALNSFAIGSASRKRELTTIALGLGLTIGIGLLAIAGYAHFIGQRDYFAYAMLPVVACKLLFCYRLQLMQTRSYELYKYFGGISRNGAAVLLLGYFVRQSLFHLPLLWALVLS